MKKIFHLLLFLGLSGLILGFNLFKPAEQASKIPSVLALKQDVKVEIKTVGELEAARSMTIASVIKGDQGKIIDLVSDGIYVQPGQILVRLDPTPFEEKIEKLRIQVKEQEAYIAALEQTLEWESIQADHKNRSAELEVEAAKLELEKMMYGDGPQETFRLKAAMQKAWLQYDELQAYSNDLIELEIQGFLNASEIKQVQKKLTEEKEAYDIAKQQYESYVQYVYPMQLKKAETYLKRTQINQEEMTKAGLYNVAKSETLLDQAHETLTDYLLQLREAEKELKQTEIVAPASGMVVLREEYRSSQKRKPRVGDIVLKNQPLIDLPDLSSMIVKTRVREVDLFKVEIGKKASIEVDAYPQLSFTGTVTSIGVLALADIGRPAEEKYFEVRITLDESDARLRPGMTTRAIIHAREAKNALTIPLHSVFNDDKQTYCYILSPNNLYEKRDIILGISNEQWAEVKTGLQAGERICLLNPFHS